MLLAFYAVQYLFGFQGLATYPFLSINVPPPLNISNAVQVLLLLMEATIETKTAIRGLIILI